MKYEADRTAEDEPSLEAMTLTANEYQQNHGGDPGFYLEIEAGLVDHASHAGNAYRTVTDGVSSPRPPPTSDDRRGHADHRHRRP